jgi:cytochrome c oxidase assembly factor CtaG
VNLLLAHDLGPHLADGLWHRWTFEPFTILLLFVSAALYAAGVAALWRRAGRNRGLKAWQAAAFYAGLVSLAAALLSPVAWLSELLFSVHMTQHEILMLIAAPLLVFGRPLQAMTWALPARSRSSIVHTVAEPHVAAAWQWLTGPTAAFLLHAAAIWIWHAPRLYEAALRSTGIHALEHLSFVLTACLFWWGMVNGRYGRAGYGIGVLYVFVTAVHTSVLGALLTVAPSLWYPSYGTAAARWNIDAIADQQLAGLLMWVPSGIAFIVFGLGLMAAWLGESERRARLGSVPKGVL